MTVYVVLERACFADEYGSAHEFYEFTGLVYSTLEKAYESVKEECKYYSKDSISLGEQRYAEYVSGSDKSFFDYCTLRIVRSDVDSGNDNYGVFEI